MAQTNPIIINSAATTNERVINAGGTRLRSLLLSNNGGAAAFVKLYNKSSTPVLAADTPVLVIPIPASSVIGLPIGEDGIPFPSGLGIAITNLVADNDATPVVLGQVKVLGNFDMQ